MEPPEIAESDHAAIVDLYHRSFISSKATIMRISGGLGFAAGLMALLFVRNADEVKS